MAEVEPYWKSLWGETAERNERAEWIRRKEGRKISNTDWVSIQIKEITSFSALNWKSPGGDKIQNYWLQGFLAAPTYYKMLQCNYGGTRKGTWMANHRNQETSRKLETTNL
jgi:hypothetical protein